MEDIPGWKPFMALEPDQTETSLDEYVKSLTAWLASKGMGEGTHYLRKLLPGDVPLIYVKEELYETAVREYVLENRNGDYVARQGWMTPPTSRRIVDRVNQNGRRNPGKGKTHD